MTNDKQRLVELFEQLEDPSSTCPRMGTNARCEGCKYLKRDGCDLTGRFVDYFLANGVIVPPCKVGDTVYVLEDWGYEKELEEKEVGVIAIAGTDDFSKELWEDFHGCAIGTFADVGKTVFLTKEEAEQALVTDKNVGSKKEEGAE